MFSYFTILSDTPYPGIDVQFASVIDNSKRSEPVHALIDTGLSHTLVPQSIIRQLGIRVYEGDWEMLDASGNTTNVTRCTVLLKAEGWYEFQELKIYVVDNPDRTHVTIGRDIINKHSLRFDGTIKRWRYCE